MVCNQFPDTLYTCRAEEGPLAGLSRGETRLMDDAGESADIDHTTPTLLRNKRSYRGDNGDRDNMTAPAMHIIGDKLRLSSISFQ